MKNEVILVNNDDTPVGTMEKLEAHQKGLLHRAISIFIFNTNGQLLIQKRADHKYHSGGLWTNTCCSHPAPGELSLNAAHRRLGEEMGMQADLYFGFSFSYRCEFDNGLVEHEFDHTYFGVSDELPMINTDEASEYKYMYLHDIIKDIETNDDSYTEWFKICIHKVKEHVANKKTA